MVEKFSDKKTSSTHNGDSMAPDARVRRAADDIDDGRRLIRHYAAPITLIHYSPALNSDQAQTCFTALLAVSRNTGGV